LHHEIHSRPGAASQEIIIENQQNYYAYSVKFEYQISKSLAQTWFVKHEYKEGTYEIW